jgi:hypothetical protein
MAQKPDYPQTDVVPDGPRWAALEALSALEGTWDSAQGRRAARVRELDLELRVLNLKSMLVECMFAKLTLLLCSTIGAFLLGTFLAMRFPGSKQPLPWSTFILVVTLAVGLIVSGWRIVLNQWRDALNECDKKD